MEVFNKIFTNTSVLIWIALLLIFIFLKFEFSDANIKEKMVACYILLYAIIFLDIASLIISLIIFVLISFFFIELFYLKDFSRKLMMHTRYYIYDYLFKMIFKYYFLTFLISIIMICKNSINFFNSVINGLNVKYVVIFISIYILLYSIKKIFNDRFNVNNFEEIFKKINNIKKFEDFSINDNLYMLSNILIEKEDKTYFIRKDKYNWFNFEFLIYKYKTFKNSLSKIYNIFIIGHFFCIIKIFLILIKIFLKCILKFFINLKKILSKKCSINQIFIGHATIEMQLIRTLAIEDGYNCVIKRKVYEIIYSTIFFSSLKDFYGYYQYSNYKYYKYYLIYIYVCVARVKINQNYYSNIFDLYKRKKYNINFTKEQVYIWSLALSHKPINYYLLNYCPDYISKKNLKNVLNKLI